VLHVQVVWTLGAIENNIPHLVNARSESRETDDHDTGHEHIAHRIVAATGAPMGLQHHQRKQ
jgi:hypothetical protein